MSVAECSRSSSVKAQLIEQETTPGEPPLKDLENIETRASSAFAEMKEARHFDYVIANHDGEDSDNWEAFYYPIGDARRALDSVAALIEGVVPSSAEKWDEGLLK